MAKLYGLSDSDRNALLQLVRWWRGGGAGKSSRPVPTRRRVIGGGDDNPTVFLAQATTAITSSTATFDVDNVVLVSGADPRSDPQSSVETILVKNTFAVDADDNDKFICFQNAAGEYEAFTSGEGSKATEFIGITAQTVASTDATFTVTVDELRQGEDPRADPVGNPAELITVKNTFAADIESSEPVWVEKNSDGTFSTFVPGEGTSGLHVIKGNASVSRTDNTFTLSALVAVRGPLPVDGNGDPLASVVVKNEPRIHMASSGEAYAVKDDSVTEGWSAAYSGNAELILQGYDDWDDAEPLQALVSDNGTKKWIGTLVCNVSSP